MEKKQHVGEMNLSSALFRWRLIRINHQIAGLFGFPQQKIDGVIKNLRGADLKKHPVCLSLCFIARPTSQTMFGTQTPHEYIQKNIFCNIFCCIFERVTLRTITLQKLLSHGDFRITCFQLCRLQSLTYLNWRILKLMLDKLKEN